MKTPGCGRTVHDAFNRWRQAGTEVAVGATAKQRPWAGSWLRGKRLVPVLALAALVVGTGAIAADGSAAGSAQTPDPSGAVATFSANGAIDTNNAFFQSLGTNGRSCATCHVQATGWTLSPPDIRARFQATAGTDPLFRTNDGTVSPTAGVATLPARRVAYGMLLSKGLIRVGLPIPSKAEFSLTAVDDPYHFAGAQELSLFRRPLPTTNLQFQSAIMWDGRETVQRITTNTNDPASFAALDADLAHQAQDATLGHAQAAHPLTDQQANEIVAFEAGLFTAQVRDNAAGNLREQPAEGGPVPLARQPFHIGINDPLGGDPTGNAFDPNAFTLFGDWAKAHSADADTAAARRSIARGERIFDTRPIAITGVGGLNDVLGQSSIQGTCTTCHDTPNAGNHSVSAPLNIGLTDASRRTPDLPLYTLHCNDGPLAGETVQTTDPGRALISGKCADIGKFKGALLRGLAARAPYFHNGSAATLDDVVNFYQTRFSLGLSEREHDDLVAFLRSL